MLLSITSEGSVCPTWRKRIPRSERLICSSTKAVNSSMLLTVASFFSNRSMFARCNSSVSNWSRSSGTKIVRFSPWCARGENSPACSRVKTRATCRRTARPGSLRRPWSTPAGMEDGFWTRNNNESSFDAINSRARAWLK